MHDALGEKMKSIIAHYIEHKNSPWRTLNQRHIHTTQYTGRCISRLSWWAYWPPEEKNQKAEERQEEMVQSLDNEIQESASIFL